MTAVVLVIGAAGVFGSRLVERLALTSDATILVAGRSSQSLDALIARLSQRNLIGTLRPCVLDRDVVTANELRALGAHIVVDAAGPFQGQHLRLPAAAIQAGCHFIDLADARDYVARFPQLDADARRASVLAVCGASSTPAISHAALDQLSRGLHRIDDVSVYISPGNRAPRGVVVVQAILSYVGRPVRVHESGKFSSRAGWSMLHRRRLDALEGRWFSLCETPDLDLIPARFPSVRNARFYAGLELSVLHCGLWLLSWLVRLRIVKSLARWAAPLHWLASRFERFGTDRGGMLVEALGRDARGGFVTARWGLVAEAGDGPYIPVLPALALIRKLIERRESTVGAQACVGLLTLDDIVREFEGLRIRTFRELVTQPSLFRRALDAHFDSMPSAVKAIHSAMAPTEYAGTAHIDGAPSALSRFVARVFGFPTRSQTCPAIVTISPDGESEVWQRKFGSVVFRSRLALGNTPRMLTEQFGPFRIVLRLACDSSGLSMAVTGWKLGFVPLPRALAPWTLAHERVDEHGRFTFDVEIGIPVFGRLVRYRGWLEQSDAHRWVPLGVAARD